MFDNDALVSAMQHVWDQVAPPAMFTAAGNLAVRSSEDFSTVLNTIKWNIKTTDSANANFMAGVKGAAASLGLGGLNNPNYGFSGTSAIKPGKQEGSNGSPAQYDSEYNYFVEKWNKGDDVYVPAGFTPIRGENVVYADSLPPFDITLTFAS